MYIYVQLCTSMECYGMLCTVCTVVYSYVQLWKVMYRYVECEQLCKVMYYYIQLWKNYVQCVLLYTVI